MDGVKAAYGMMGASADITASQSQSMIGVKRFIQSNILDLQFWGYEGGNVLATVAGAGGFERFVSETGSVIADGNLGVLGKIIAISRNYPDGFVTIALGSSS